MNCGFSSNNCDKVFVKSSRPIRMGIGAAPISTDGGAAPNSIRIGLVSLTIPILCRRYHATSTDDYTFVIY